MGKNKMTVVDSAAPTDEENKAPDGENQMQEQQSGSEEQTTESVTGDQSTDQSVIEQQGSGEQPVIENQQQDPAPKIVQEEGPLTEHEQTFDYEDLSQHDENEQIAPPVQQPQMAINHEPIEPFGQFVPPVPEETTEVVEAVVESSAPVFIQTGLTIVLADADMPPVVEEIVEEVPFVEPKKEMFEPLQDGVVIGRGSPMVGVTHD